MLSGVRADYTAELRFRNRTAVLFDVTPSHDVTFRVRDEKGRPSMASFVIKDKVGRVYPARSTHSLSIYLDGGIDQDRLMAVLGKALLREDRTFHTQTYHIARRLHRGERLYQDA